MTVATAPRTQRKPGRHQVEVAECGIDVERWITRHVTIEDPQGEGTAIIPFALWRCQQKLLWTLVAKRQVLILKARQLGISWLVCAYALWICLYNDGRNVLLFSKGQTEANELIRRILGMYTRLPPWMLAQLPKLLKDNTEELLWDNGSRITSLPATQHAGRSFTASLVVMDEAAFMLWAEPLYTALKPTIDAGGRLIILSTANGIGNLFHLLWDRASQGIGSFQTVFIPWWERPGRDQAWYDRVKAEQTDPEKQKQEYPESAEEAFIVTGHPRFDTEWVDAQQQHERQPLPLHEIPEELRGVAGLRLYAHPRRRRRYVAGADVAEGLLHGDWNDAVFLDKFTWEEMAEIHNQREPDEFADDVAAVAAYFDALIGVERNNHGHTTIARLKRVCPRRIAPGEDKRLGWLTNIQTKPVMIDRLAEALRDASRGTVTLKIRSSVRRGQLRIYQKLGNGKTGAPAGFFDDCVMSLAIALAIATRPGGSGQAAAGGERTILKQFRLR